MSAEQSAYNELLARVRDVTGLNDRAAGAVATSLLSRTSFTEAEAASLSAGELPTWTAKDIADEATALGYEFDKPKGAEKAKDPQAPAAEVSMNPVEVLGEVYMTMPRVMCQHMPKIGKAPDELRELDPEIVDQLPEDVLALLVKVDMIEGKATFWLRDEANDIDRPIGPIDLTRYDSGEELHQAFETLMSRLPLVLAADFN